MTNLLLLANPPPHMLGDVLDRRTRRLAPRRRARAPLLVDRLRALSAKAATLGVLERFLLEREEALDLKQLATLEWWIDYCESFESASSKGDDYETTVESSAYSLKNIELHKGASRTATRRFAVKAHFGMIDDHGDPIGANDPESYHWKIENAPNNSIDILTPVEEHKLLQQWIAKPSMVLLQSVTKLSTLHLIGSVTRPGVERLGAQVDLIRARIWWPEQPTPQEVLVATIAESGWAKDGAKAFTTTLRDMVNNTYMKMLMPGGQPVQEELGSAENVDWFRDRPKAANAPLPPVLGTSKALADVLQRPDWENKNPVKYFARLPDSYKFTRNAIAHFAKGKLAYKSEPTREDWLPLTLMNAIVTAYERCLETLKETWKIIKDQGLRTTWFKKRKEFIEAYKEYEGRKAEPSAVAKAAGPARKAWDALAKEADSWGAGADVAELKASLQAWDNFVQKDSQEGWRVLSNGPGLSKRSSLEIFEAPMVLFHFKDTKRDVLKGIGRDVLIRADYKHLYKFEAAGTLGPVLEESSEESSIGVAQIGLSGAAGHATGPHLHVQTTWCDADPEDAAACLDAPDKDAFRQWVTSATNAPALPSGKKAPGTWRKMPAAFLFPKAG